MSRALRGFGARTNQNPTLWFSLIALLAVVGASAAWLRGERLRTLSAWQSRLHWRAKSTEGLLWPTRISNIEFEVSPNSSVGVARLELSSLPWQRLSRARGVVIRGHAPLDTFWEEARRVTVPADIEVMNARIEYTDAERAKVIADDVSFEPGARRDHLHAQSLYAFGTTFHDLDLWVSRPGAVLEIQLARTAEDSKAPKLNVTRSPGEGVEWALEVPSQPFSEWATRIGLKIDQTWPDAIIVGTGSVIVPDSPGQSARADLRFTVDNWHCPSWPEARLLTGRSGAVALRISPGRGATHEITRVEVAAGLFSLVGTGQLLLGEPNRLVFGAQGELSCALLLAHLPASGYRDRVQAYLRQHREDSPSETRVRLELAVRAEAPRGPALKFRWHLHAGCGLSELTEE